MQKYLPLRKRKDSKGRSVNLDLINIVFAFVALNVAVATFLKGLLMLDKQDQRTRVQEHIFKPWPIPRHLRDFRLLIYK